jgi:hypothetical protein
LKMIELLISFDRVTSYSGSQRPVI